MNSKQNSEQAEIDVHESFKPYSHERIKAGDILWSWCSVDMVRTDHLWTGHKLICLECHPEYKPSFEEQEKP